MMTGGADEASGFLINSLVSIQGDVRMQEPMAVQGAVTCQEMRNRVWKDFSLLLGMLQRLAHCSSLVSQIAACLVKRSSTWVYLVFSFSLKYALMYIPKVQKSPKLINSSQLRRCVCVCMYTRVHAFDSRDPSSLVTASS